jgi:hypothetical protein
LSNLTEYIERKKKWKREFRKAKDYFLRVRSEEVSHGIRMGTRGGGPEGWIPQRGMGNQGAWVRLSGRRG